jgi:hypothetical protein
VEVVEDEGIRRSHTRRMRSVCAVTKRIGADDVLVVEDVILGDVDNTSRERMGADECAV